MSLAFSTLNRHLLLHKSHMLSTALPLERRRQILSRALRGLIPYLVATALAFVSPYATLVICAAVAVYYALPIASGGVGEHELMSAAAERDLRALLGAGAVLPGATRRYLTDATESRAVHGRADAIVLPSDAQQVASVVRWCYDHDVALTPRGGGTGLAAGAVPSGGVVLSLERLRTVRSLQEELWRAHVEAGITTADVARLARENGLLYPPDPGAAEQSQIGGNIATNAGGPHTFKYGVTGAWVTGLELVIAPGELISIGGPARKDVAGYDIKSLIVGSEGTLAVVTAAWLRLTPAPESQLPVVAILRERRRWLRRRWGRCSARGSCRPRSSISTRAPWPPRRRRFRTPFPAPPRSC